MATLPVRQRRRAAQPAAPRTSSETGTPNRPGSGGSAVFIELERRHAMISDAAYFLAERRSFCPGRELDDWLVAEREIDRALTSEPASQCG